MQKRISEVAVGVFFILGIGALVILALKVSGLSDFHNFDEGYRIKAEFENVGNLKPRARVAIAGVAVGRVVSIEFDSQNYLATVNLLIDKNINNIPDDSSASILTAGLLGDNYISLTPGFSEQYYKDNSVITTENTNKAVVLEELISKFLSSSASGLK